MISNAIVKAAGFNKERRQPYHARPSMAGPERCIRAMVYHALGIPEGRLMNDRAYLVMDDSSWHETLTGDALAKTAFRLHSQQMGVDCVDLPFDNRYFCKLCNKEVDGLHGHIDGLVTDILGAERLFEHKALNRYGFEEFLKKEWPLDYLTQGILYLKGVRRINPAIQKLVVCVKCKDTSRYLDVVISYDEATDTALIENMEISGSGEVVEINETLPNVIQGAVEKFAKVAELVKVKTLPARPFPPGTDYPCGWCNWWPQCDEASGNKYKKAKEVMSLPPELQAQADEAKALRKARLDAEKAEKAVKAALTGQMLELEISRGGTQAGTWASLKKTKDGITVEVK